MSDLHPDEEYQPAVAPDQVDVDELLQELVTVVERAKSMPLSSSAIIARDEVLGLLEAARAAFPAELQRARRVLQDRDEVRVRAEREAAELLDEARAQSAYMVQRAEVVRQARHQADRIIEDAESEGRKIRHEADDYVDRKLAAFEIVLDRTMRTVQAGRERLTVLPELDDELDAAVGRPDGGERPEEGFFDQDRS
ncbi:MAG: synthase [Acidimicrobiaceae bacterium]|nr:synthase [Acidimicrobiaceae bacterium]